MTAPDLLIALRLKGFAKPEALPDVLGRDPAADLATLETAGLATATKLGARLSPAGQAAADAALAAERAAADPIAAAALYDSFHAINAAFKALVADWQLRDGQPNDHADAAYDAAILARLAGIHARLTPIVAAAAALAPRLARYTPRFATALARLTAGDIRFMAAPLLDSYHSVWFELHEELIRLSGRTRAAEAAAGRA
ncbi:MarR family transcriptional regulator [Sandaracinobacteroides saxicola]|uniref:MarR family transcriptional regulator n=1 Tax=Sandaracinobacteroides saxicola TaxID=2759707 RepID=A0A7G5IJH6_9SPHN|nr:MarR family transcriptional regulator [Sandaracinobacteroides saxicola]QMW23518.1 MarR family transcriptional regulator [Sandaracinobacteroides saxicola]